jgi:hypothetical protein
MAIKRNQGIKVMTCPLENQMIDFLEEVDIDFNRPDQNKKDPTTLDFYLIDLDLYIEVKQFHSDRISEQLSKVPEHKTAIVLQGPNAMKDFIKFCRIVTASGVFD